MHPQKQKGFFFAVFGAAAVFFASFTALASSAGQTEVNDFIEMKSSIYEEHQRPIVSFTHKKHSDDYGISCGKCHHDEKGQALTPKAGDPVQSCAACHSTPGERPKGKNAPKLSKQERLTYHAEAMHENCISCHRGVNKKAGDPKKTPTMCNQCHAK